MEWGWEEEGIPMAQGSPWVGWVVSVVGEGALGPAEAHLTATEAVSHLEKKRTGANEKNNFTEHVVCHK